MNLLLLNCQRNTELIINFWGKAKNHIDYMSQYIKIKIWVKHTSIMRKKPHQTDQFKSKVTKNKHKQSWTFHVDKRQIQ